MTTLSLRLRSLLLLAALLLVFVPITIFTLDRAFNDSLVEAKQEKLSLMALSLVSAFRLQGNQPVMPEVLYQEQLNLPASGYWGAIVHRQRIVWQSASSIGVTMTELPINTLSKDEFIASYTPRFAPQQRFFVYRRRAEFAAEHGFEPVDFYIFNDIRSIEQEREAFRSTAWRWLALLTLLLMLTTLTGTSRLLAPIRDIMREINRISAHQQRRILGDYPDEFDPLKDTLNRLIAAEEAQRERHKNRLDDLAHSLKTPLAVLHNDTQLTESQRAVVEQIQHQIVRQLKRATAAPTSLQQSIPVTPAVEKLISALDKVYRDKCLHIVCDMPTPGRFRGDETDLLEILGNVLDNAYKAANAQIAIRLRTDQNTTALVIEDDGAGIAPQLRDRILQRGTRLDSYEEGHGLGMAITQDLLAAYEGSLLLETSRLGGLAVTLKLPA